MNRIKSLSESPCYKCYVESKCYKKIRNNPQFGEIKDMVFGNSQIKRKDCPLYIALTCKNLIDES